MWTDWLFFKPNICSTYTINKLAWMCARIGSFEWFGRTKQHQKHKKKNISNSQPRVSNKEEKNRQNERKKRIERMSGNLRLWSYNNIYTTKRALTSNAHTQKSTKEQHSNANRNKFHRFSRVHSLAHSVVVVLFDIVVNIVVAVVVVIVWATHECL